ncbi:MAG: hypothetical protein J6N15_05630 [Ruminiclostridium sp.]|nr:hypothetical protein [Ruminiclostridium sp.]
MTGKDMLRKMELVDPEFIETAGRIPKRKPIKWQQWTALAACLMIAVISGVMMVMDPDAAETVPVSGADTASLFSTGGAMMILLAASLLGALAVIALMIRDKRSDRNDK